MNAIKHGIMKKYWAYRHVNGGIHLKRYRDDMAFARESIDDAYDSPFVEDVLEPFPAETWVEAEKIAKLALDKLRGEA